MAEQLDGKFYQAVRPNGIAERLLIAARERIYADFIATCGPSPECTILDVGVSDVVTSGANFLERMYPHQNRLVACGLGEAREFQAAFPAVRYRRIEANGRLPFGDREFEVATSNAVLEHVGSADNQRRFVAELCRVGRTVFISVPNRYFPVEHHTAIPFFHWHDAAFGAACVLTGKGDWALPENLILMSRRRLGTLLPQSREWTVGYTGLPLGPFSSNLFAASVG